jgi:hypothetical protein
MNITMYSERCREDTSLRNNSKIEALTSGNIRESITPSTGLTAA